ncbi:MAG: radical SAM protein, partial [Kiritimatiellia bacterium]|nr:radical SAM protein [Kiritimatiellia bacterium]
MKILLVSPGPFVRNRRERLVQLLHRTGIHGGDSPPLGLASIGAAAEARGHQVRILDMRVETPTREEVEAEVRDYAPDLVGYYIATFNIRECVAAARFLKTIRPEALSVAGGPNVSLYPRETLEHDCFDFAMRGECDETFPEFLERLAEGKSPEDIPGVALRLPGGGIQVSPALPFPADLDQLPMPAHHLFRARYRYFGASREPYTSMIASRGCPFNCNFCGRVPGSRAVRTRSAEKLLEEMKRVRQLGYREVNFFDDLFTVNRKRVIDLCRALVDARLDMVWSVRARVDSVDEEMLDWMRRAGCRRLYFGVESGSDRTLGLMNKKITTEKARRALHLTRQAGLESVSYFIVGYPGETEADMEQTVQFIRGLETDFSSINMFEPLPACNELVRWMEETRAADPWLDYLALRTDRLPYFHGSLDRGAVERAFRRCWSAFYLQPRVWFRLLRLMNSPLRFRNFA